MTLAIFHPAFEGIGGAEILVATQAQYLERHGLDVCVATTVFDAARWRGWFERIPVRVTAKPSWTERFANQLVRIKRTVPRAEACLSDCQTVMACNFPTNVILGASSISARRVWCSTEPSRDFHPIGTNPRLYQQVTTAPGGISEAEQDFARRLVEHRRSLRKQWHADLIAFDIEQTQKLDSIYAISEFARDSVRRVYGRTDAEVIYPVVRFPAEKSRPRSGLNRAGLNILTHSRLEIPKNVGTVVRAFALFLAKQPGARLHIVGEGTQRTKLGQLTRTLGISKAVQFRRSTTLATSSRCRPSTSPLAWSFRKLRRAVCSWWGLIMEAPWKFSMGGAWGGRAIRSAPRPQPMRSSKSGRFPTPRQTLAEHAPIVRAAAAMPRPRSARSCYAPLPSNQAPGSRACGRPWHLDEAR
jgi:glycosyltransferase involved in cell wall biosynthesis